MLGLGPKEMIILAGIFVLLFGTKKIPELSRSLSEAVRELRKGFSDEENNVDEKTKAVQKVGRSK